MNSQEFISFLIICLITHTIRTIYEILKHKKSIKANGLTFLIILINMIILWVSWFAMSTADLYQIFLPKIVNYLGGLLFLLGVILFLTALFTIKSLETYVGDLITRGIYSKIRHPMYLGFIFWLIGIPVYYGALTSFLVSFLFIGNVLYWKFLEEQELVKRFPNYAEYRKQTLF